MKLGLQVSRFTWPDAPASTGATWRALARNADQAGLASLWVMDHFFQISMVGPAENALLDSVLSCSAVGSRDTVRAGIQAFVERTGADELMITSQVFDHEARLRSYELLAELRDEAPAR